jgi:hypothetical protein
MFVFGCRTAEVKVKTQRVFRAQHKRLASTTSSQTTQRSPSRLKMQYARSSNTKIYSILFSGHKPSNLKHISALKAGGGRIDWIQAVHRSEEIVRHLKMESTNDLFRPRIVKSRGYSGYCCVVPRFQSTMCNARCFHMIDTWFNGSTWDLIHACIKPMVWI